jgi:hypothetical protein
MLHKTLFHELTGVDPRIKGDRPTLLTPDTVSYFFLAKGHVMEFYRIGPQAKKVVALFFGPEEFVLPSHTDFSGFAALDKVETEELSHRTIVRALRNFEGANIQYRVIQERYREKVRARVHAMQSLAAPERYAQLKAAQPWVLDLAKEEDVANYLGISVRMLREFVSAGSSTPPLHPDKCFPGFFS